jgi:hypothetical protein
VCHVQSGPLVPRAQGRPVPVDRRRRPPRPHPRSPATVDRGSPRGNHSVFCWEAVAHGTSSRSPGACPVSCRQISAGDSTSSGSGRALADAPLQRASPASYGGVTEGPAVRSGAEGRTYALSTLGPSERRPSQRMSAIAAFAAIVRNGVMATAVRARMRPFDARLGRVRSSWRRRCPNACFPPCPRGRGHTTEPTPRPARPGGGLVGIISDPCLVGSRRRCPSGAHYLRPSRQCTSERPLRRDEGGASMRSISSSTSSAMNEPERGHHAGEPLDLAPEERAHTRVATGDVRLHRLPAPEG